MRVTFGERLIAYLILISGLSISTIAIYYSVMGLSSIFAAASISVIIMGLVLEVSKLIATVWLKINWQIASISIRLYLISAISVLMLITSMGIFGFLSRAHSDQAISNIGITAELAVYDEKIQLSKETIEDNRKILKQLDEAVDQTIARSTSTAGSDRAVAIRRSQQKERLRISQNIEAEQAKISSLIESKSAVESKLRAVQAEVGPIKYIAEFFYGTSDSRILEKAVTWVIIILITVFDPLAVVLLLAAQTSFQDIRRRDEQFEVEYSDSYPWELSNEDNDDLASSDDDEVDKSVVSTNSSEQEKSLMDLHPYLNKPFVHFSNLKPVTSQTDTTLSSSPENYDMSDRPGDYLDNAHTLSKDFLVRYVQNEEQNESGLWSSVSTNTSTVITQGEYIKYSQDKSKE